MAQIESVDWINKLIYLHADTVTNGFDAIAAYFEINQLVFINANNEQHYYPPMSAEGNIRKTPFGVTPARFTPRYAFVFNPWDFVPVDTPHDLDILTEMVGRGWSLYSGYV